MASHKCKSTVKPKVVEKPKPKKGATSGKNDKG